MKKQTGVALFVCLMILLVLSLLGISAMRMMVGQNMISTSSQGADIAFDASETGINRAIIDANAKTLALPVSSDAPVTKAYPADTKGITATTVVVSRPDLTGDPVAGARALAAMVTFGAVPGVSIEQFRFTSNSTVEALNIQTTHVQDTIYPHL